ncbi:hypothetical protein [Amycolatopsis sp. NPDC001319]|uniref:hypothetical protein n=1 Tax=unclassified Amycolatopsis TaxID=2618356 RepID=UPI003683E926
MNASFPQSFPQHGVPVPRPPKRGLGAGWIIAIVVGGLVVVAGVALGAVTLSSSGGSYDEADSKYGTAPLPRCDEVAARVGNLPPKTSETALQGSKGWLCTFADAATSVRLDLEVNTVQRQHAGFDVDTSSGAYVVDPALHLGEKAAWGLLPSGQACTLAVLDSNATFKVGIDNRNADRGDTETCKIRAATIAQALYGSIQPR